MTDHQETNPIHFDAPAGCPDKTEFSRIVDLEIKRHFGTKDLAAQCRKAWHDSQAVPEPFASNPAAAGYYQMAALELDTRAQQWVAFEEAVNREFAACEDDGADKQPAIPGWTPEDWISF